MKTWEEKVKRKKRNGELKEAIGNWPNQKVVTEQTYLFETLTAFVSLEGRMIPSGYVIFRRQEQPDETVKRNIRRALLITSQYVYKNKLHLEINTFYRLISFLQPQNGKKGNEMRQFSTQVYNYFLIQDVLKVNRS